MPLNSDEYRQSFVTTNMDSQWRQVGTVWEANAADYLWSTGSNFNKPACNALCQLCNHYMVEWSDYYANACLQDV